MEQDGSDSWWLLIAQPLVGVLDHRMIWEGLA